MDVRKKKKIKIVSVWDVTPRTLQVSRRKLLSSSLGMNVEEAAMYCILFYAQKSNVISAPCQLQRVRGNANGDAT
jgi:hypothetical protein